MDEQKVSPEDLELLQKLQKTWDEATKRFGVLRFEVISLQQEMNTIDQLFIELNKQRSEILSRLQQQFGTTGTVNFETGVFESTKT